MTELKVSKETGVAVGDRPADPVLLTPGMTGNTTVAGQGAPQPKGEGAPNPAGGPARSGGAAGDPGSRRPPPEIALRAEIEKMLHAGPNKVARQIDLINLHKRLVADLAVLGEGIGQTQTEAAAADRAELVARLDEVEKAMNGVEALLRIQLAPEIRKVVDAAIEARMSQRPLRRAGLAAVVVAAMAGVAVGAAFYPEIVTAWHRVAALLPGNIAG